MRISPPQCTVGSSGNSFASGVSAVSTMLRLIRPTSLRSSTPKLVALVEMKFVFDGKPGSAPPKW